MSWLAAPWDKEARDYAELSLPYHIFTTPIDELLQSTFWRNLLGYAAGLALEAGCGTGKNSLILARNNVKPVLMDFSRRTIVYCKDLFRRCGCDALFVVADVTRMPFKTGVFDFVHSDSTLEHVVDYTGAIREIARVTGKGGYIFATVPNKLRIDGSDLHAKLAHVEHISRSFTPKQLKKSFETYLKVIKIFGYDVISPTITVMLRRLVKNAPSMWNIKTNIIRDKVARSAARYTRAEAGSSALELMFLSWLDKRGAIQRTVRRWLVEEHSCLISLNLGVIARK
jgi:ubiquinone/menaquinone biosynthesis C-methylase UbiE